MSGDSRPVHVDPNPGAAEWEAYVARSPGASAYHRWKWRQVFERAFRHRTHYLAARRDGVVVGLLPLVEFRSVLWGRFAVSLPFVNYGGIVADDGEVRAALAERAVTFGHERRLSHVELRHDARQVPGLAVKQHKVAMLLPLADTPAAAWEAIDRKARNQVRKAQKCGLTVSVGGPADLPHFYGVFAANMRDLGTPVYPRRFFEEVTRAFDGDIRVVIAWTGRTPVAAALTYRFRDRVEVPWASSRREFLAQCPNTLLYWSIIEGAIADGARVLDFGRSTPGEGTYHFKRQWGAQPYPLFWEYALIGRRTLPDQSPSNPRVRLAVQAWKRLPLPAATMLGPHIVRTIP